MDLSLQSNTLYIFLSTYHSLAFKALTYCLDSKTLFYHPITLFRTQNQSTKKTFQVFACVITSHWKNSPKCLLVEITAYQIFPLPFHSQELLLRRDHATRNWISLHLPVYMVNTEHEWISCLCHQLRSLQSSSPSPLTYQPLLTW